MPSEIHADIGSSNNQNPLLLYGDLRLLIFPRNSVDQVCGFRIESAAKRGRHCNHFVPSAPDQQFLLEIRPIYRPD
jgi:hypothetical protein